MNATMTNGRQRKSLANEIDRLEATVDALAIGLNEAVATVVEKVVEKIVRDAVQTAVAEVLANPELRKKLAPPKKSVPSKVVGAITSAGRSAVRVAKWVSAKAVKTGHLAQNGIRAGGAAAIAKVCAADRCVRTLACRSWVRAQRTLALVRRLRRPLLTAAGIGFVVGVGCYVAGPAVASVISGLAAMTTSMTAQALSWLRRNLPHLERVPA